MIKECPRCGKFWPEDYVYCTDCNMRLVSPLTVVTDSWDEHCSDRGMPPLTVVRKVVNVSGKDSGILTDR